MKFPRLIFKRVLLGVAFALLLSLQGPSQSHSAFPVDITAGPAPQPVMADGRFHLLYELHLTNFSASSIELLELDVIRGDGASPLASYRGEQLEKLLVAVGGADGGSKDGAGEVSGSKARAIAGGRTIVIFLDLALDAAKRAPAELRHRFLFTIALVKLADKVTRVTTL
jgi:hypothetical protein